jgi:hypothetical protein
MSILDTVAGYSVTPTLSYAGNDAVLNLVAGGQRTIKVCPITAKPRLVPAASNNQEFREMEVRVSARDNTEGLVSPKALFGGQAADWFTELLADDDDELKWWIVDIREENDPTMHRLVLRDKEIPKEYGFGG